MKKNFEKMDSDNKSLVTFVITSDGYLRVNFKGPHLSYVGATSNFHKKYHQNFLGKCTRPMSWSLTNSMTNLKKDLGRIPFKRLYRYRIMSTLNRDDYSMDGDAYTMTPSFSLLKRVKTFDDNIIQSTENFLGLDYTKDLTADQIKTIKKFNRFDEEVAKANLDNLDNVVTASQYSYFLHDNQYTIRETFISEL